MSIALPLFWVNHGKVGFDWVRYGMAVQAGVGWVRLGKVWRFKAWIGRVRCAVSLVTVGHGQVRSGGHGKLGRGLYRFR